MRRARKHRAEIQWVMRTRAGCREATVFVRTTVGTDEAEPGMQAESLTRECYHMAPQIRHPRLCSTRALENRNVVACSTICRRTRIHWLTHNSTPAVVVDPIPFGGV